MAIFLQESGVRVLLHLDQVGNIDDGGDPGVVLALPVLIEIQCNVHLRHAGHLLLDLDHGSNLFKLFFQFFRFVF